jgi:cytosine deaminase
MDSSNNDKGGRYFIVPLWQTQSPFPYGPDNRTTYYVVGDGHAPQKIMVWCNPAEAPSKTHKLGMTLDPFMQAAIAEARQGLQEGGIPIGSVLVKAGQIVGRGHNRRVQQNNPILHAEIDCLQNAGRIGRYQDTVLYSTLMPCYLCAGAIVQFGIKRVVAGESSTFPGTRDFLEQQGVSVLDLDLAECKQLMQDFITRQPLLWNEDIGEL